MKYRILKTCGYIAIVMALFSCNLTKSKEAAPNTNSKQTQQTQQSTEQTPKALTDAEKAEKAKQEKITALQNNCTGFSGTYDYNRFDTQNDDTIRFLELKCAQARGDNLKEVKEVDKVVKSNGKVVKSNGANLLHSAAGKGDLDSVKFLIETPGIAMDVDSPNPNDASFTALIYAAENGHLNVVKYLVGKNADTKNFNIYYQAIHGGHLDIIKYFIECANVKVNLKSITGKTMLISAVTNNQLEIVKYLISKGADTTIKSVDGTACELARKQNYSQADTDALIQAINNCTAAPTPPTPPTFSCAP